MITIDVSTSSSPEPPKKRFIGHPFVQSILGRGKGLAADGERNNFNISSLVVTDIGPPDVEEDIFTAPCLKRENSYPGKHTIQLEKRGDMKSFWNLTFGPNARPDGQLIATATERAVRIWDSALGNVIWKSPNSEPGRENFTAMAFTRDSGRLVTASGGDRAVTLWDARTGERSERLELKPYKRIEAVGLSPDGSQVTAISRATAYIFDLKGGGNRRVLFGREPNQSVVLSADALHAETVFIAREETVERIDTPDGKVVRSFECGWTPVMGLSGDGSSMVTADRVGAVRVWLAETGELSRVIETGCKGIWEVAIDFEGRQIAMVIKTEAGERIEIMKI
ncbi:hypothetical protein HDV00_009915 [Rhizophlyctis rosea]|nr:hypothetical protein HDV00_009915 [Rhizophlyctis rosea]